MIQGDGDLLHGSFQFLFGSLALQKDDDLPTGIYQIIVILLVTFAVTVDFCLPECRIGLWQYELSASLVTVPETAVDENRRSVFAHYDVRLAGHALDI